MRPPHVVPLFQLVSWALCRDQLAVAWVASTSKLQFVRPSDRIIACDPAFVVGFHVIISDFDGPRGSFLDGGGETNKPGLWTQSLDELSDQQTV